MGLSTAHTADKLKSIFVPVTISGGLTDNYGGLTSSRGVAKVTEDRASQAKRYSDYIKILSLKL